MRDFVVRMRKDTSLVFASPAVKGLSVRLAAAHELEAPRVRRRTAAISTVPRCASRERRAVRARSVAMASPWAQPGGWRNGEDLTALKARSAAYASRMENADLVVPAGQRARYEAAFARFSSVFPDVFYVRERGRFYPDDSEDKGRC